MKLSASIMMVVVFAAVLSLTVVQGKTTVTSELKTNGYSSFLTDLRKEVTASTVCGLPSTTKTPSQGAEYVYADLKFNDDKEYWVTLGLVVTDLYVWGYQDKGTNMAYILKDAPDSVKNTLFPNLTIRTTAFGGNYNSLEYAAGTTRVELAFNIPTLQEYIKGVYNKGESVLNKAQAKFFLITIQMVSEAARFKFMEEAIVRNDNTSDFKVKMVAFQAKWDKISERIHTAPNCDKFTSPLNINGFEYTKVNEVKNDMGLLKYK